MVCLIQINNNNETDYSNNKRSISKRITVSRVSGHGQQRIEEMYRGQVIVPDLIPKIKIEIAVNDEFVDITVNTILESARTNGSGNVGDGKIFITPLEECIRIRTGERGSTAI
jgi:nitrogen regulatory protein P-II 1